MSTRAANNQPAFRNHGAAPGLLLLGLLGAVLGVVAPAWGQTAAGSAGNSPPVSGTNAPPGAPSVPAPDWRWKAFYEPRTSLYDYEEPLESKDAGSRSAGGGGDTNKVWSCTLAAGVTLNSGNTDARRLNGSLLVERKGEVRHELRLGLDGNYGTDQGETSVDNAKADANYHYRLTRRWYLLEDTSFFHDAIAEINYRLITSPGVGYYVVREKSVRLGTEAGPAYLRDRKGGEDNGRMLLRLAELGEWKLLPTSKIWEALEYLPEMADQNVYLINAEAGVESAVSSLINVRLVIKDIYDNNPAPGRRHNDTSVIAALSVKL